MEISVKNFTSITGFLSYGEEPDGNLERKIFWKTRWQTTWEVRGWSVVLGKKKSLWMSHRMLYRVELSHVYFKINIFSVFLRIFQIQSNLLTVQQGIHKCCHCIHRQCHPKCCRWIWEHRSTGWNEADGIQWPQTQGTEYIYDCFCEVALDCRLSLAMERFPFYAEKTLRVLSLAHLYEWHG